MMNILTKLPCTVDVPTNANNETKGLENRRYTN